MFDHHRLLELTLGTVVVDLILILAFNFLLNLLLALALVLARVTKVCCVVLPLCCV